MLSAVESPLDQEQAGYVAGRELEIKAEVDMKTLMRILDCLIEADWVH